MSIYTGRAAGRVYRSSMCYKKLDPGLSNFRDNDY